MIYAWFTFWLCMIIFAGAGVYHMLGKLVKPVVVNWLLLPGTIVSEMAYIFGCLITGGEIRKSRILPESGSGKGDGGGPATEAQPKLKYVGPVAAALIAIVVCGSGIVLSQQLLGTQVISQFTSAEGRPVALSPVNYPDKALPATVGEYWNTLWDQLAYQVTLLRKMTETLSALPWRSWPVPLFVYLTICLAVRLSPARRPIRSTLVAAIVIAAIIALIGSLWKRELMTNLWPLLTFTWSILLLSLVLTLIATGIVTLLRMLAGKMETAGKAPAPKPKEA